MTASEGEVREIPGAEVSEQHQENHHPVDASDVQGDLLGRAERALRNFQETWPVFIVLMLIGHLAMPGEPLILWGAIVWGVARIVYLPLYLFGVFMIRSLVWNVSLIGLVMMGWAVLF